ncbi:hypothetical protein C8R45DRAFT_939475 [Mycena sanguinolenta]|nr:hypothetical protein C8R45DRAFT_939475 [Mycena sanguinolenta]
MTFFPNDNESHLDPAFLFTLRPLCRPSRFWKAWWHAHPKPGALGAQNIRLSGVCCCCDWEQDVVLSEADGHVREGRGLPHPQAFCGHHLDPSPSPVLAWPIHHDGRSQCKKVLETILFIRTAIIQSIRKSPASDANYFDGLDSVRLDRVVALATVNLDSLTPFFSAQYLDVADSVTPSTRHRLTRPPTLVGMLLVRVMFAQREKGVKISDTRARLSNEVLQGIHLIEYYAWEGFCTHQIGSLRECEIATVPTGKTAIVRAALHSSRSPVLASVLCLTTYALRGHDLKIAIILSSLQCESLCSPPLPPFPFPFLVTLAPIFKSSPLFFLIVLTALADVVVAFGRIGKFLTAEELPRTVPHRARAQKRGRGGCELRVGGGNRGGKGQKGDLGGELLPTSGKNTPAPSGTITPMPREEEKRFELTNFKFSAIKGAFMAIVGKVRSGKSSILQALIGEMRKTSGSVVFGGTMAYVPQIALNVAFGLEDDEDRSVLVVVASKIVSTNCSFGEQVPPDHSACNLEHDLDVLPHGEEPELRRRPPGRPGGFIRWEGSSRMIVFCMGLWRNQTRILVTHTLHADEKLKRWTERMVSMIGDGQRSHQGAGHIRGIVQNLLSLAILWLFYRATAPSGMEEHASEGKDAKKAAAADASEEDEKRNVGAVTLETYSKYLKFAGGLVWAPIILLLLTLAQAAQELVTKIAGGNLFLGFWTGNTIHGFRHGENMAVYTALGLAQVFFSFLTSFAFALTSLMANLTLFKTALAHILRLPASFFDTTPMGRILSQLVKDLDTLDNQLSMTFMQLLTTFASVLGTVGLVFYTFSLLGIIFAPMTILYYLVALYYGGRLEAKRLASLMRSSLYASYTGLQAYFMTISLQLWLGLRLDVFGNILVLGIALFAAEFRHTVDPSKIGVVFNPIPSALLTVEQLHRFSPWRSVIAIDSWWPPKAWWSYPRRRNSTHELTSHLDFVPTYSLRAHPSSATRWPLRPLSPRHMSHVNVMLAQCMKGVKPTGYQLPVWGPGHRPHRIPHPGAFLHAARTNFLQVREVATVRKAMEPEENAVYATGEKGGGTKSERGSTGHGNGQERMKEEEAWCSPDATLKEEKPLELPTFKFGMPKGLSWRSWPRSGRARCLSRGFAADVSAEDEWLQIENNLVWTGNGLERLRYGLYGRLCTVTIFATRHGGVTFCTSPCSIYAFSRGWLFVCGDETSRLLHPIGFVSPYTGTAARSRPAPRHITILGISIFEAGCLLLIASMILRKLVAQIIGSNSPKSLSQNVQNLNSVEVFIVYAESFPEGTPMTAEACLADLITGVCLRVNAQSDSATGHSAVHTALTFDTQMQRGSNFVVNVGAGGWSNIFLGWHAHCVPTRPGPQLNSSRSEFTPSFDSGLNRARFPDQSKP